jgi:hypothetical protein
MEYDNMDIKNFQTDLQNGMSIDEACQIYNITLKQAFNKLHYKVNQKTPHKKKQKWKHAKPHHVSQYIQERNGHYYLRKHAHGKGRIYGTYNTLEDAIIMREALKKDGWHQTHVERLCQEHGITRCKGRNQSVRYH